MHTQGWDIGGANRVLEALEAGRRIQLEVGAELEILPLVAVRAVKGLFQAHGGTEGQRGREGC